MTPDAPSDPDVQVIDSALGPIGLTDVGTGPAIVAVHGLPGSVRDFRWLAPALEPHLRLVRIDLPASGDTPLTTMADPHVARRAEVIVAAMDFLKIETAAVLGHSMGGPVATAAAWRFPDRFTRVACVAAVGPRIHRGFRRMPNTSVVQSLLEAPVLRAAMMPLYRAAMRRVGFRGHYTDEELIHMNRCISRFSFARHASRVHALAVPTLVAWADDDPLLEPAVSLELANIAPAGPRLNWATGGHNIQKSRATEIAEVLVPWLTDTPSVNSS